MDTSVDKSNTILSRRSALSTVSDRLTSMAQGYHAALSICILFLVTLVTRAPLLGIAETDSALFVVGVRQWLRGGSQNLSIYSAQVCAGYYATVVALIRCLHLGEQDCALLMSWLSLLACLGILGFGYLLGERFVGSRASLAGMLLFAFSPGLWWITVEPHPQAVSICFGIAALWSSCRYLEGRNVLFALGSIVCLGFAVAVKNDAILMVPAMLAVVFWVDAKWRNAFKAGIVAALGVGLSLLLDRLAAGSTAHPIGAGKHVLANVARIPTPFDFLRDCVPIFFGIGIVTVLTVSIALIFGRRKYHDLRRWCVALAIWCLPGYIFWLCISGNNIRHVVFFGVPLFWLGGRCLRMPYLFASLMIGLLLPANSNVGMFPSPDVPGSQRMLARKEMEVASLANLLSQRPSCFLGSYTNDLMLNALLDLGGRISSQLPTSDVAASVSMPNGSVVTLTRINPREKSMALGSCQSLEYDAAGRKVRFLGGEWHLPIV